MLVHLAQGLCAGQPACILFLRPMHVTMVSWSQGEFGSLERRVFIHNAVGETYSWFSSGLVSAWRSMCSNSKPQQPRLTCGLPLAGSVVSPWHDVPLYLNGGLLSFICEIPSETHEKMEVATVRVPAAMQRFRLPCRGLPFGPVSDKAGRSHALRTTLDLSSAGRAADAHQAGCEEGQAALLPVQHPLELRHAATDLGGPHPQLHSGRRPVW